MNKPLTIKEQKARADTALISLSKYVAHPEDLRECRKNRNWESFDQLDDVGKMLYRIQEIKEYLIMKGYEVTFNKATGYYNVKRASDIIPYKKPTAPAAKTATLPRGKWKKLN